VEIPKNLAILSVERTGRLDSRGQPINETIYARKWARIELRHSLARGQDGDVVDIDGELWVDDMELLARDLITVDNDWKDTYRVFDVRDAVDVMGGTFLARARLQRQRQT
jgi:hypothetical protein